MHCSTMILSYQYFHFTLYSGCHMLPIRSTGTHLPNRTLPHQLFKPGSVPYCPHPAKAFPCWPQPYEHSPVAGAAVAVPSMPATSSCVASKPRAPTPRRSIGDHQEAASAPCRHGLVQTRRQSRRARQRGGEAHKVPAAEARAAEVRATPSVVPGRAMDPRAPCPPDAVGIDPSSLTRRRPPIPRIRPPTGEVIGADGLGGLHRERRQHHSPARRQPRHRVAIRRRSPWPHGAHEDHQVARDCRRPQHGMAHRATEQPHVHTGIDPRMDGRDCHQQAPLQRPGAATAPTERDRVPPALRGKAPHPAEPKLIAGIPSRPKRGCKVIPSCCETGATSARQGLRCRANPTAFALLTFPQGPHTVHGHQAGGKRQEAGGSRREAEGRRLEARGRRQEPQGWVRARARA